MKTTKTTDKEIGLDFESGRPYGQVTVGELRQLLALVPQAALVSLQGCDCDGPCEGVLVESDGTVQLTRGFRE